MAYCKWTCAALSASTHHTTEQVTNLAPQLGHLLHQLADQLLGGVLLLNGRVTSCCHGHQLLPQSSNGALVFKFCLVNKLKFDGCSRPGAGGGEGRGGGET
jgi:hypothetical protein